MKKKLALVLCSSLLAVPPLAFAKNDHGNPSTGDLPPGLQKKVDAGGDLPPGWQKKLHVGEPIDYDIYRHHRVVVPVDDKGLVTIEIGGKLIRMIEATREVVEVLQ